MKKLFQIIGVKPLGTNIPPLHGFVVFNITKGRTIYQNILNEFGDVAGLHLNCAIEHTDDIADAYQDFASRMRAAGKLLLCINADHSIPQDWGGKDEALLLLQLQDAPFEGRILSCHGHLKLMRIAYDSLTNTETLVDAVNADMPESSEEHMTLLAAVEAAVEAVEEARRKVNDVVSLLAAEANKGF